MIHLGLLPTRDGCGARLQETAGYTDVKTHHSKRRQFSHTRWAAGQGYLLQEYLTKPDQQNILPRLWGYLHVAVTNRAVSCDQLTTVTATHQSDLSSSYKHHMCQRTSFKATYTEFSALIKSPPTLSVLDTAGLPWPVHVSPRLKFFILNLFHWRQVSVYLFHSDFNKLKKKKERKKKVN